MCCCSISSRPELWHTWQLLCGCRILNSFLNLQWFSDFCHIYKMTEELVMDYVAICQEESESLIHIWRDSQCHNAALLQSRNATMVGLTSEVHHLVVLIHSSRCCKSYSWPGGGTVTRLVMNKLIMVVTQTIVRLLLTSMLRMFKFLQLMYIIAICRTSSPALCSSSTPTSCSTLQCVAEVTEVEKAIR